MLDFLTDDIYHTGVYQFGFVPVSAVRFRKEIRDLCELCEHHNQLWRCPPAIGTFEECKARCSEYDTLLLFTGLFPLDDQYDLAGMQQGAQDFKIIVQSLEEVFSTHTDNTLVLSIEGCENCVECTYPQDACRNPETIRHSIEGYGLHVGELAEAAQVDYDSGLGTVTYFGAIFFNSSEVKENN